MPFVLYATQVRGTLRRLPSAPLIADATTDRELSWLIPTLPRCGSLRENRRQTEGKQHYRDKNPHIHHPATDRFTSWGSIQKGSSLCLLCFRFQPLIDSGIAFDRLWLKALGGNRARRSDAPSLRTKKGGVFQRRSAFSFNSCVKWGLFVLMSQF